MLTQTTPLSVLVAALRHAKADESAANLRRLELESQIIARFPVPHGGEGTVKDEEFSIAFKVTRTVDTEALQSAWPTLSDNSQKAFAWKAVLDTKKYRAVQEMDAKAFAQLANFVTTKPAKTSVTLKD